MKLARLVLAGALLLSLTACVVAPVVPPRGILFTDQTSPLFPGGQPGTKVGTASSSNILFLVGWGDSGLNAAMQEGGITKVNHVDYELQNYVLIYQKYTTRVWGE